MKRCNLSTLMARTLMLAVASLAAAPLASAQSIIVDNADAGFSILSGSWETGSYGNPYGSNYRWTYTTSGGATHEAEWRPTISAGGGYGVSVYYVAGSNRANDATFTVHHAFGDTPIPVNQEINGETWVDLGTFTFNAGTGGYVTLHNDADPVVIIADAVRFTPVSANVELTMEALPDTWGTTDPAPGGPYTYFLNEVVNISAGAYTGYEFDHWEVTNGALPADIGSPTTTVTMDETKTVRAVFVEETIVPPEFRGFWADAFSIGYKSQAEVDYMIARAIEGNYNAIVPEVLAFQDTAGTGHGAYWNSAIVPKANDIAGGFDPLAYMVQEAHAAGIEVHAWLVTYRICSNWPPVGNPTISAHPEWVSVQRSATGGGPARIGSYYFMDPGSPDVQDYLISIVRELVGNYEIDGIHWDYVRATEQDSGYPAYTSYAQSGLARFQQRTGYAGTPSDTYGPWQDFRRTEITELVRRAQVEVATIPNPQQPLRHSAALITWGGAPSSFQNTSSWTHYQNWEQWTEDGHLDAAIPMCYFDWDVYPNYFMSWVDQTMIWRNQRHAFIGPGIYLNTFDDSVVEIDYARNAGANGICTYVYSDTNGSRANWWEWYPYVAANAFFEPAPTPPMPWRNPLTTTEGHVYGRVTDGTTGQPLDNATVRVNGFYAGETDGNGFFVITRVTAGATGTPYAISASYAGYSDAVRPAVSIERAGYTEANLALGDWLFGDYDVDADVDGRRLRAIRPGPGPVPTTARPPPAATCSTSTPTTTSTCTTPAEFQAAFTG